MYTKYVYHITILWEGDANCRLQMTPIDSTKRAIEVVLKAQENGHGVVVETFELEYMLESVTEYAPA